MINRIQDINKIFREVDNEKHSMSSTIHISDILVYTNKNIKVLKIQRILTPQRTAKT
jgi:mevalonate pyrophosphate decarboxylase